MIARQGLLFDNLPTVATNGKRLAGILAKRFVAPPFTLLDCRQGYWLDRKRDWGTLGVQGELGRGEGESVARLKNFWSAAYARAGHQAPPSTSVFDSVLCELVYRWWAPPAARVLDPFAGEATKGLVAAVLGYEYVGVELRPEQVAENYRQAATLGVRPTWMAGDSVLLDQVLGEQEAFDLVFTSPPYFDLEQYRGGSADGSTFGNYPRFLSWLSYIFAQAKAHLRPDRFFVVKMGEVRDPSGAYRNLVGETVAMLTKLGLTYYNEAVLATPLGSLPLRSERPFVGSRKLGKAHQNVLVFYNGDPAGIREAWDGFPVDVPE